MLRSARAFFVAFSFGAALMAPGAAPQTDPLGSITVLVQTFGRPHADFPATIQIHSSALDADLSSTADKPTNVDFPNLPAGLYRIFVTGSGLSPAQLDVTLSPGQSIELSLIVDRLFPLILQPLRASVASSPALAELPLPNFDPASLDPLFASNLPKPTALPLPVASGSCSLADVLPHVSANVREFVDNVNRITATELLYFERRRRNGRVEDTVHHKVNYVANFELLDSTHLSVEEFRDGFRGMSGFTGHLSAVGAPALVLVFHPIHVDEFDLTCQGVLAWQGTPVYMLSFEQRPDRPNTMSEFRSPNGNYPINLKGFALVDALTFQVVHLETDLLQSIPEVSLDFIHQALDYGPVPFVGRSLKLWLPQFADIDVRFRGKEFSERHSYTNYQLFVIETGQKIGKPKEESN